MANRVIWGAGLGVGFTWTALTYTTSTATQFNSLAAASVVSNLAAITNQTALDLYADLSFTFVNGATTTTAGARSLLWLLPLNQDGTTYGDNSQPTIGTKTSVAPAGAYQVGAVSHLVGVASGTALVGMFRGIVLPPGSFVFCIQPNSEGALNATATATIAYRTYIENLNG